MKIIIYLLVFITVCSGCGLREREQALEKRESELNQKEQELLLKEKSLALKEEDLQNLLQLLDSGRLHNDTLTVFNPALVGKWSVQMVCTETTCTGFAVGDSKTEEWEISYQGTHVLAKAMAAGQLVRVYSGVFNGSLLEMTEDLKTNSPDPAKKMLVRLRLIDNTTMEGQRETTREGNCKVVYELKLNKQ